MGPPRGGGAGSVGIPGIPRVQGTAGGIGFPDGPLPGRPFPDRSRPWNAPPVGRRAAEIVLPALTTLREVQRLDGEIGRLDQRLARYPGEIAARDREEEEARQRVAAAEKALEENGAARRRAEGDLEDAEAALEKYQGQLLGAKTNVEYSGLQQQIESTRQKIGASEDLILELMEQADDLTRKRGEERSRFEETAGRLERERNDLREGERRKQAQRKALEGRRAQTAAKLSDEHLAQYERVRNARGGLAVTLISEARCDACHVRLRPQLFEEARRRDRVLACESCSRILIYRPEPEPAAAATAPTPESPSGSAPPAGDGPGD